LFFFGVCKCRRALINRVVLLPDHPSIYDAKTTSLLLQRHAVSARAACGHRLQDVLPATGIFQRKDRLKPREFGASNERKEAPS